MVLGRGGRCDMQRLFKRIGTSTSRMMPTSPDVTSREMAAVLHGLAVENEVAAPSALVTGISALVGTKCREVPKVPLLVGGAVETRSELRAGSVAVGDFGCAGQICVRLPGVASFPWRELVKVLTSDFRLPAGLDSQMRHGGPSYPTSC